MSSSEGERTRPDDDIVRRFIRSALLAEGDEPNLVTDFVIVSGYLDPDGDDGICLHVSDGTTGYAAAGLLALAATEIDVG